MASSHLTEHALRAPHSALGEFVVPFQLHFPSALIGAGVVLEAATDHQLSTDAACSQLTARRRLFPQDEEGKSEAASREEVGLGRWGSPLRPSPRPCLSLTLRKSCIVSEERKPRPWDSYELLGSLVRGDGTCPARDPEKQGEATNRVTLPLTWLRPKMVSNGLGVEYPLQAHAFAPLSQLVLSGGGC